jgi:hypothetical protein
MSFNSDNNNTFSPILPPFVNGMKPQYIAKRLYMIADDSGSTNNGGGRFGSRFGGRSSSRFSSQSSSNDDPNPPSVQTKTIHIAIDEGNAQYLASIANRYNMEGVRFKFAHFSSTCRIKYNMTLKDSKELYDIACKLGIEQGKEFSSTNLTGAINMLFPNELSESTVFVVASDGLPDDRFTVIDSMFRVVEKFKQDGEILHVFSIGAGSIKDSSSGTSVSCSSRGGTRHSGLHPNVALDDNLYKDFVSKLSTSSSECDKSFLVFVSEFASGVNAYAPACQDYSLLLKGVDEFHNRIESLKADVVLYTIETDSGTVVLSQDAQQTMNVLKKSSRDFGFVSNQFGNYVLSTGEYGNEPYQLRVREINYVPLTIKNYKPDPQIIVCFLENITLAQKSKVFNLYSTAKSSIEQFAKDAVFVAVYPDGSRKHFKPETINDNSKSYFRIRSIKW